MKILQRKERTTYGYYKEKMVAIDYALALTLFANNSKIYMLYKDNTEKLAESVEDLLEHTGLYGVNNLEI